MPWTYILECRGGAYYTGSTNGDLESRVWEHNRDDERAAAFTRERRPVFLAYAEEYDTVDAAFRREKQIQGGEPPEEGSAHHPQGRPAAGSVS